MALTIDEDKAFSAQLEGKNGILQVFGTMRTHLLPFHTIPFYYPSQAQVHTSANPVRLNMVGVWQQYPAPRKY